VSSSITAPRTCIMQSYDSLYKQVIVVRWPCLCADNESRAANVSPAHSDSIGLMRRATGELLYENSSDEETKNAMHGCYRILDSIQFEVLPESVDKNKRFDQRKI
jgi:hypothetical protein